jgi:hypothetical protein
MRATRTVNVDFRRLQGTGSTGVLVLMLMRAANDLAIANAGYRRYEKPAAGLEEHIRPGARRYFVRLQCGHLYEAMPLVRKVRYSRKLREVLSRCDEDTQTAFDDLVRYVTSGPEQAEFRKYVGSIRNKIAFHYDQAPVSRALADRAARQELRHGLVTLGTSIDLWRFDAADDIEGSIVIRELWEIPRTADIVAEDDRISGFGSRLCRQFIQFAGGLSVQFVREFALAT